MPITMRVSRPGYDCLTDGTIDHYSIYADSDNVLIKEKNRGTIALAPSAQGTIAHNLGYIPFFLVYAPNISVANSYNQVGAANISATYFGFADTTNIYFENDSGGSITFKYFIFYDQQV